MGLSIKVKNVIPAGDMLLHVTFENGVEKCYDVKQLIPQYPIFKALENPDLFNMVAVDGGGYAIAWNADLDISECDLWENGETIR